MNWKIVLLLSLFGVAMGVASLFGLTRGIEPFLWLLIFILYAWLIARHGQRKYFLHGFLGSVLNGIWISIIHASLYSFYLKNNPEMLQGLSRLPPSISPRVIMLIIGPIVGVLFGVIAGLFAFVGAKVWRSREPTSQEA
jgi:hypothetical protein